MPEDTPEITKAKEEKAKARHEKIEKDKEERKRKLKEGDSDPGELQMCVIYHNFLWLQSFLSGYMSEVEDTKHLNENDHVFKSEKFAKRFPEFKTTTPQEAAAEIVLIEGTHMTLQAEGKAPHEKKVALSYPCHTWIQTLLS